MRTLPALLASMLQNCDGQHKSNLRSRRDANVSSRISHNARCSRHPFDRPVRAMALRQFIAKGQAEQA
jgi:hypothetical protein